MWRGFSPIDCIITKYNAFIRMKPPIAATNIPSTDTSTLIPVVIIIDETAQNTATGTKLMNSSVIFMKILLSSSARSSTLLEAVSPAAIPRMHPSTVSCIALLLTRGCITLSGIIFFSISATENSGTLTAPPPWNADMSAP